MAKKNNNLEQKMNRMNMQIFRTTVIADDSNESCRVLEKKVEEQKKI